jgi:LytS/YehU family sensor histidine kinase
MDYHTLLTNESQGKFWETFKTYTGLNVFRNIYYLILSTVVWSALNLGKFRRSTSEALLKSALAEKVNADLKFQFASAQNALLKQQINPHLLFNTLNTIYSGVYLNSPKDSKQVLLLSEIMRYSFEEPNPQGLVPLRKEIEQLENLIKLNSYRYESNVRLDFNVVGDVNEHMIIPLVLLTLTENMFKHGDLRADPRYLEITVETNGRLRYLGKNVPQPRSNAKKSTAIGLKNTRLRLDYAYPGNYELTIQETDELFTLELNINSAYERDDH